jgi:HAE1 family hydrophobic/amphiphilic exporter-1
MNISELSIKRPIFMSCVLVAMMVVGIVSFRTLPVDLFPDVTFPIVTVTVPIRARDLARLRLSSRNLWKKS